MRCLVRAIATAVLTLTLAGTSFAAELKVLSAGAVESALTALVTDYETAKHSEVRVSFGNVGTIEDRLKAGEAADIVILSESAIDMLGKKGGVVPATAVVLGGVGMGVAVRRDMSLPYIATPESFKAALLAAPSIAYSDPASGSSGKYFDELIARMGIAAAIRKKAVLIRGGSAADAVAHGSAAMGVQNISELINEPNVRLAGPFPAVYQNYLYYSAAVSTGSKQAQMASAFIAFIARPEAAPRWRAGGFEAPHGK